MEGIRYNKFSSGLYLTCPDNDMEMSPSWSRAHDWKSCNRQKRFESSNLSISAKENPAEMRGFPLLYGNTLLSLFFIWYLPFAERTGGVSLFYCLIFTHHL